MGKVVLLDQTVLQMVKTRAIPRGHPLVKNDSISLVRKKIMTAKTTRTGIDEMGTESALRLHKMMMSNDTHVRIINLTANDSVR
jgi:hypothetical protein